MAFGDIIQQAAGGTGDSIALSNSVVAGNSLLFFAGFRTFEGGYPTDISDSINGSSYTEVYSVGDGITVNSNLHASMHILSNSLGGSPVITPTGSTPFRWALIEAEGAFSVSDAGGVGFSDSSVSSLLTASDTISDNSVSFAFTNLDFNSRNLDVSNSPWATVAGTSNIDVYKRSDTSSATADLSGPITGGTSSYAAGWASFTEVAGVDYTARKGSTETITHTLTADGITTATLDGETVTIGTQSGQDADIALDETAITTSGEYDLVLGDGTDTETFTVQYNVIGLATNTLQKEGDALADLSDVRITVLNAAGTRLDRQTGLTTNATGVTGTTIVAAGDPEDAVEVSYYSASAEAGITFVTALELL